MAEGSRPPDRISPGDSPRASTDLDSTSTLIDRARAGDTKRSNGSSRDIESLSNAGPAADCRSGRAISPIPRTLSRRPCFRRSGGWKTSHPRGVGALQAYLRQAVLNRIRDELRRKGRQPAAANLDDMQVDSADSPLEQAIGREAVERYEQALARLKAEEREAIIARVEMGYTYEELAEALGKPTPDAARKAARRALVRLAEELKRGGA